jgi:phosphate transport system substrate-binding protein
MFLGKITAWNDPAIAKENPGVTLPETPVTIVSRSDGSGVRLHQPPAAISEAKERPRRRYLGTVPAEVGGKGAGVTALIVADTTPSATSSSATPSGR